MRIYTNDPNTFGWFDSARAMGWKSTGYTTGVLPSTLYYTWRYRWFLVNAVSVEQVSHENAMNWFVDHGYGLESGCFEFRPALPQLSTGEL
jgi:hypothetical protein